MAAKAVAALIFLSTVIALTPYSNWQCSLLGRGLFGLSTRTIGTARNTPFQNLSFQTNDSVFSFRIRCKALVKVHRGLIQR